MSNQNEIKQIYYTPYYLNPIVTLNSKPNSNYPRQGVILRIDFTNFGFGYADCHPWIEFGDQSMENQLKLLAKNIFTPLTCKSIYFAKIDAYYRNSNKSVFNKKNSLKNHIIMSYEIISIEEIQKIKLFGFNFIKLKFGFNLKYESELIKKYYLNLKENNIKLRLDFNSSMSFQESMNFFFEIRNLVDIIDFVEDPCDFHFENWKKIQNTFDLNLALDRKTEKEVSIIKNAEVESLNSFGVIILKPALDNVESYLLHPPMQRIVFTSYMDHPFGQACGIYEAENFYEKYPKKREHCGFLTHSLYEKNLYSNELQIEDTILRINLGTGFGFEKFLTKEKWIFI